MLAGGGAGLIETPLLLLMGIPPQTVVASRKFSAIGGHSVASYQFQKAQKIRWDVAVVLTIISIISSVIGAMVMVRISTAHLHVIIASMMLFAVPFIFLNKSFGLKKQRKNTRYKVLGYSCNVVIYIIDAISAVGGGIISSLTLIYFMGLTYLQVSAIRRVVGLATAITVSVVYWYYGLIDWFIGFSLMLGGMFGSYFGVRLALKKGNVFMKGVFLVFVLISAVKILLSSF